MHTDTDGDDASLFFNLCPSVCICGLNPSILLPVPCLRLSENPERPQSKNPRCAVGRIRVQSVIHPWINTSFIARRQSLRSRQNLLDHLSIDIRESKVSPLEPICQARVVHSQQVQDRG